MILTLLVLPALYAVFGPTEGALPTEPAGCSNATG